MPDYSFFLSYASTDRIQADRDSETTSKIDKVKVFFDDLDRAMKGHGYSDGGFFDKKVLEGKWKRELREGLASSRILVPLYSPNYFKGEFCGKEWETFNLRFDENESHIYPDVTSSRVILPVCWKVPVIYPEKVKEYQVDYEGYSPDYRKYGLEYMLQYKRNTQAYGRFLLAFSLKLRTFADSQGAAKVRDLVDFDSLNPPFPGQNQPGLGFVRYVCVAGMRHQMSTLRTTFDCYPTFVDRRDWRPCFPDLNRQVDGIATVPAACGNRTYQFVAPLPQLMSVLRDARRLNNIIVVIVDPWSVQLPELHQFLKDFDAEEFPNSAVLVNWNGKDPETSAEAAKLQTILQNHFNGRKGRKEYHKDPVSSVETISQAVEEAFGAVQARLIELGKIRPAGEGGGGNAPVIRN